MVVAASEIVIQVFKETIKINGKVKNEIKNLNSVFEPFIPSFSFMSSMNIKFLGDFSKVEIEI